MVFTFYMLSGYGLHAVGLELDAIAAVVIGGTLLTGGVGYVVGTLFGVLMLGIIQTLIAFDGTLSSWWTRIVVGALLFVFCLLQRLFAARASRPRLKAFSHATDHPTETALDRMVRHGRQERLHVPQLDEEPGHPRPRVRRPADHRHLQHLVGADALQRALPQDRRARASAACSEAGGFPVEFPVFSNGESNLRPTAMLTRNLASMDVEEAIRGNPIDAVVLLTGCDKTTPALLMGAASCDVPAIVVTGGPMLNGKLEGRDIGSGTAVWQLHEAVKAGEIDAAPVPVGRGRHVALGRHLQHDGHGLDDGLHGRGARHLAAAQRGDSRRSTRAATCWRRCRACASSRWRARA